MHDGVAAADAHIRANPELAPTFTLHVAQHGQTVFEGYYRNSGPEVLHCIHSVTKSVASTVAGILAGDGALDLDRTVASLLPTVPAFEADPAKKAITIRHLLTMSSGLYGHGWWDIDDLAERGVPLLEGALEAPLVGPPGYAFLYNNGASHLLSALVEVVTGRTLEDVAAERLFAPLGIGRWRWPTDPQGRPWACGDLELTGPDLLKLGLLYLGGGTWNGRRVVDEAYVRTATSPLLPGGPPEGCGYGLLWWVADRAPIPYYFAGGYGGQYVIVVPSLDLVALTLADGDAPRPVGGLLRQLVVRTVVPAFAGTAVASGT